MDNVELLTDSMQHIEQHHEKLRIFRDREIRIHTALAIAFSELKDSFLHGEFDR